jgi:hypothetical protein
MGTVDDLLAAFAEVPAVELRGLGRGLQFGRETDDPLRFLGELIWDAGEHGIDDLSRLKARFWLRMMGRPGSSGTLEALLEGLEGVTERPWPAVREALEDVA